jgi:hypothetical protein
MTNESKSTGIEFEILKLVFFSVTYLLITDGMTYDADTSTYANTYQFYNSLFIFSASTWVDYLSVFRTAINKRYYSSIDDCNTLDVVYGSVIGAIIVVISMYCVCKKNDEFINLSLFIYHLSIVFFVLKAHIITKMILKSLK